MACDIKRPTGFGFGVEPKIYCVSVCVCVTYMSVLVKKVQSIQIYSQDAGCLDGGKATALDVEKGGAEHGKRTDQT